MNLRVLNYLNRQVTKEKLKAGLNSAGRWLSDKLEFLAMLFPV